MKVLIGKKSTMSLSLILIIIFTFSSILLVPEIKSQSETEVSESLARRNLLIVFLVLISILTILVIIDNPISKFLMKNYKLTIVAVILVFLSLYLFPIKSITGFLSAPKHETTKTVTETTATTIPLDFKPGMNEIDINDTSVSLDKLQIDANNQVKDVEIDVSRLDRKPDYASEAPGIIYQYIKIDKTNIDDTDIKKVNIIFKVEKSWITGKNIIDSTVSLHRYQNNVWVKLLTEKKSEEGGYVYYEAVSRSLSLFAITGENVLTTTTTVTTSITTTVTTTTTNTTASKKSTTSTTISTATSTIPSFIVTFDRTLDCQKCGQHKAPPLTDVKMTITATISSPIQNTYLIDYYPSEWTVTDSNQGTISIFNSTYNTIRWNIPNVQSSVSKWYMIKSPQRTLPPTKYYFFSEMQNQKSNAWDIIVSDPTKTETQYVNVYNCTANNVNCTGTTVTIFYPDGSAMTVNYQKPVNIYNATLGKYTPINTTVVSMSVSLGANDFSYGVDKGFYNAYFKQTSSQLTPGLRPVAMVKNDYILMFTPSQVIPYITWSIDCETAALPRVAAKQASTAEVSQSKVTYPNQYKQYQQSPDFANLSFIYENEQLKEELVIWDKNWLQTRFDACYRTKYYGVDLQYHTDIKAYYQEDVDSKSLGISIGKLNPVSFKQFGLYKDAENTTSDEVYFTDQNNNTVYIIPRLYAWDSNGSEITLNKTISMTNAGNLRVTVLTPFYWLNSSERVYPVYIDPTTITRYDTEIDYYSINNTLNGYYFNASNAEQRVNDIQNYWAKNDVCLGLYFGNKWNEFCGNSLDWVWYNSTNFTTYTNLTGTALLSYAGYEVNVKSEYYLGVDYPEVRGIITLENVGNKDISDSYIKIKTHDININKTYQNDTFRINTTSFWESWSGYSEYWLNESLNLAYNQNDLVSRKFAVFDNTTESWIELEWNDSYWKNGLNYSMNYNVSVKKLNGFNSPVDLLLLTGALSQNDMVDTQFKLSNAKKQNFTDSTEIYQGLSNKLREFIGDSNDNAVQFYAQDWDITIEMKPNNVIHFKDWFYTVNETISSWNEFSIMAWKFECFELPKPNSFSTIRCPENKTNLLDSIISFAQSEIQLQERNSSVTYATNYLLLNNQTGVLDNYTLKIYGQSVPIIENEKFRKGRIKLSSLFDDENFNAETEFDVYYPSVSGASYCIRFPIQRWSNLTINVTMLSPIFNFTFGREEFIIQNYTIGNSVIARIRPYPCCGVPYVQLQSAEVCAG